MATKQITLTLSEKLYNEIVQAKQEETTTSIAEFIRQIISEKLEENRKRVGDPLVFVKTRSDGLSLEMPPSKAMNFVLRLPINPFSLMTL